MNRGNTLNETCPAYPSDATLNDLKQPDWNVLWKAKLASRAALRRDAAYWDGRAHSFAKATETSYRDQLLALMNPNLTGRFWTWDAEAARWLCRWPNR